MRIWLLGARGVLSFDDFRLSLERRLTVVVGSNGAGKSNLLRLMELCVRVIQSADRESTDLRQVLASFLMARRVGHASPGVEVRVGFELTDATEKALLVAFVRAAMVGGILENWTSDPADIDAWAIREVTEELVFRVFRR